MQKYLIVGLGNIGNEYTETRHNIGFKIAEGFATKYQTEWQTEKYGSISTIKTKGKYITLLKPNTYMNLSGKAVLYWKQKLDIDNEQILIIVDELAFPLNTLRLKAKGSSGGHNGLKSIESLLSTSVYPRLRVGIGQDFEKGQQVAYVLGNWTQEENKTLPLIIERSIETCESWIWQGIDKTMEINNKK